MYSVCFLSPVDIQDLDSRLGSMLSLLQSCPDPNRHTFLYLLQHLQRSDYSHTTPRLIMC